MDAVDGVADELAALDRAMAALEAQRATMGDVVVDTALAPLRRRREELGVPRSEERRLVTVVFADLVDFTVLSGRLDPEDTRTVVGAYFARWQEAIEGQGGVVEKFIGDAVMAVFGLRRSFEDDAQRAIRAALAMTAALPVLSAEIDASYGVELHMRVGLDTGEVVVSTLGERAGGDFVAVGPTVNRAARLQAAAPVDRVMISAETHRLVRGRFGFEELSGLRLKGIDEPVDAYLVGAERPAGFDLDRAGSLDGVTSPTVGRDSQLAYLQERLWDVFEDEEWRVVTVVGDAGVGKSRLLQEFDAWLAENTLRFWWFRGRASPSGQDRPLGLLRDLVAARLGIQENDAADDVRRKLEVGFASSSTAATAVGPDRAAHAVGTWLGFDLGEDLERLPTDPQALRDLGTDLLARYFAALSETAPVVILLEDLHWADDGSLRWLDAAGAALADSRVLVVATTRPVLFEDRPHWTEGLEHHERLRLPPLSRRETRRLVRQLLRAVRELPSEVVELVVDGAEGNPFYAEELVTWLLDAGVVVRGDPDWFVVDELVDTVAVPATLRGVLQSRLDALEPTERGLLQRASVVGRVFWDEAVARLGADPGTPGGSLESLRRRELVFEREVSAFGSAREFLFKHALLRDVAYDSVLRAHRERYHLRAAQWLAEVSALAGRSDEYAALVAEHYARAGAPEAADFYLRAGRQAAAVFALEEATRLLGHGLELASEDRPGLRFDVLAEREGVLDRVGEREAQHHDLREMEALEDRLDAGQRIRLRLAQARWAFGHSEYDEAQAFALRAADEAREHDRPDQVTDAELWRGRACTWADRPDEAREHLRAALDVAQRRDRPDQEGEAYRYLAMVASNVGQYDEALRLAARAGEVFASIGDVESESMAVAMAGTTAFHMGRYEEARTSFEQVLPVFRRSGHRYRIGIVLGNLASISQVDGRLAAALQWSSEAVQLGEELEDLELTAVNLIVRGMTQLDLGRWDEADVDLERAVGLGRDIPSRIIESEALCRLVLVRLAQGDVPTAVDHGRAAVDLAAEATELEGAYARLALGYAQAAAGDPGATDSFAAAERLFADAGVLPQARESAAGRAGLMLTDGEPAAAADVVRRLLAHLDPPGLQGTMLAGEVLRTCVRVLREAGDPQATAAADLARAYLRDRTSVIGHDRLAAEYLAVPANRALLDDA